MVSKGWQITFAVHDVPEDMTPVQVIVEGEIGDISVNTWQAKEAIFYLDEDHVIRIAQDAVFDLFEEEITPDQIQWVETAELHPDHYIGKEQVDLGVWI